MHFQYYNVLDQSVLFVVSMLLLGSELKADPFLSYVNTFRHEYLCYIIKYSKYFITMSIFRRKH